MSTAAEILFALFLIVLLAVAIAALWVLWQYRVTERVRAMRHARLVEQRITDIGLQTQAAILNEALKRTQVTPTATTRDIPWSPADSLLGPWNDRGVHDL